MSTLSLDNRTRLSTIHPSRECNFCDALRDSRPRRLIHFTLQWIISNVFLFSRRTQ